MRVPDHRSVSHKFIALLSAALVALAGTALATPTDFEEDFAGPTLDPVWVKSYEDGHLGILAGAHYMTAMQGGGFNPKLQRFDTGSPDPIMGYTHEISVIVDTFGLTGGGGTQSDFKWKSFGADGFTEIVLNSFGDMRLFHSDGVSGGNIQPNVNIGIADGDVLGLRTVYDAGTDSLNVTYSINGGAQNPFYSGSGINGTVGNTVGNFVEVEVFKWGAAAEVPVLGLDQWNLTAIPEPGTIVMFGLGGLALMVLRRRG